MLAQGLATAGPPGSTGNYSSLGDKRNRPGGVVYAVRKCAFVARLTHVWPDSRALGRLVVLGTSASIAAFVEPWGASPIRRGSQVILRHLNVILTTVDGHEGIDFCIWLLYT